VDDKRLYLLVKRTGIELSGAADRGSRFSVRKTESNLFKRSVNFSAARTKGSKFLQANVHTGPQRPLPPRGAVWELIQLVRRIE
jgi:hypothetical protein